MSTEILSIRFVPISKEVVLTQIQAVLSSQRNLRIATINPEYLLEASKNEQFLNSLQNADIRTVDGFGIQLMAWLRGTHLPRVTGADLVPDVLMLAQTANIPVVIYNKPDGLSSDGDISRVIMKAYPELTLHFSLPADTYALVLCTYGAPEQELFLDTLESLGIKIGIGGALDYLTGKQSRAPRFIRAIGLEWLWRLILQPSRMKRIWNATGVFFVRALFGK
jgi:N-acetylglucosaminyldiphosphoundecaprenol N-acetyl-beta-D-mannosaminyltransferase